MVKNRKQHIRLGPITKGVLGLVAVGSAVTLFSIVPGLAITMKPFFDKKKYQPKQAIEKSIDSLIKKGLLKKSTNPNGEIVLTLTRKGKWETSIRGLGVKEKTKEQKWDGIWRIIVFDVPEHKRRIRNELRRALNLYGFQPLQKSVWVYPYPCDDFIKLIKTHLGISNDVLYMTAEYIENDKHLKTEFKL